MQYYVEMPCNKFNNLASESTIIGSLTSDIIVLFVFDAFIHVSTGDTDGYWDLVHSLDATCPCPFFNSGDSCVCVYSSKTTGNFDMEPDTIWKVISLP